MQRIVFTTIVFHRENTSHQQHTVISFSFSSIIPAVLRTCCEAGSTNRSLSPALSRYHLQSRWHSDVRVRIITRTTNHLFWRVFDKIDKEAKAEASQTGGCGLWWRAWNDSTRETVQNQQHSPCSHLPQAKHHFSSIYSVSASVSLQLLLFFLYTVFKVSFFSTKPVASSDIYKPSSKRALSRSGSLWFLSLSW